MRAFLIGAGASRGAVVDAVVPTAAEFGQVLAGLSGTWRTEFTALAAVVDHLGLPPDAWSLEPVWSCLDWYAKLQPALPLPKPWHGESRDLKKALLGVFGRRCDDLASCVREDSTLATLLRDEIGPGDTVVSFNYDTIFERVAARCSRKLVSSPCGDAAVAFAKPHGSTSWTLDLVKKDLTWLSRDAAPLLMSLSPDDVDRGLEPLLLGAVPIKSELIREVQREGGVPTVFDVVSAQWRILVEAVRDCDTLVVVGYSFPAEDRYGRFLLQEGMRLRRRGLRVELFELPDKAAERHGEILAALGARVEQVVHRGPVLSRAA
jgi:hypothetical protein